MHDNGINRRRSRARLILTLTLWAAIPLATAWLFISQPMLPTPFKQAPAAVDPARLEAHVRMLSATLFPRSGGNPENLDRVAGYIRQEFARAGAKTVDQPFVLGGTTYRNVIARFGPETTERIIVGAHYDTYGELPGADDNASGVAGLIELAYLLKGAELKTRVELVAFTLEEPPTFGTATMGSAFHAAALKRGEDRVRVMISLEMIGFFKDSLMSQKYPAPLLSLFYPSTGDFIAVVGKWDQLRTVRRVKQAMRAGSPLPVHSINAPTWLPGIDLSDHRSYWREGYEAVMISDTAFYRNPNYHTARDTADTLDYGRMAMVVKGVQATVVAFDKD